jgi:hypothetical protein
MLGIAFVVVVALGLAYVARRSRHPRGVGAFRTRSAGALPLAFTDDGGSSEDDDAREQPDDATDTASDSSSDSAGSGGDSDGGGGDGGGGE